MEERWVVGVGGGGEGKRGRAGEKGVKKRVVVGPGAKADRAVCACALRHTR